MEKVTHDLGDQVQQRLKELRKEKDKLEIINFLKKYRKHIGAKQADSAIRNLEDDTVGVIDKNLMTYEDIERKEQLRQLREKYGVKSHDPARDKETISFRGRKGVNAIVNSLLSDFQTRKQSRNRS